MKTKCALLIIDMLNDFKFPNGETLAAATKNIVSPILKIKEHFRSKDWPVIYINDHYQLWKADINLLVDHITNEVSAPIIKEIKPEDEDYFLIKPKHSAFYATSLSTLLSELDVDSVVVTGVAGNICVLFTANDAYMREFNIYVPKDAIASEQEKFNNYALSMMENVLKAEIRPSAELIELLS